MEGTINYSSPDAGAKFYQTDQFLKEAGEAMGLPPYYGAKVARKILRVLVKTLDTKLARQLSSSLPEGLKQECENIPNEIPKEEKGAPALNSEIAEAAGESADPEEVARNFWSFARNWLEQSGEKELPQRILESLPDDMKKFLSKMDDKWSQEML